MYAETSVVSYFVLNITTLFVHSGKFEAEKQFEPELQAAVDRLAGGRPVDVIELYKPENTSLGFSVVGLKSDHKGELGIYVQQIQPGGIASR